ncbi:MAG: 50S ribosomal protein L4, partial [Microthrixaceae bacterium]
LSDRAAEDKVIVVSGWDFEAPKTQEAQAALLALGVIGRSLLVIEASDKIAHQSFRNLPGVHIVTPGELNTYDVLVSDYVVFTSSTLPTDQPAATSTASSTEDSA